MASVQVRERNTVVLTISFQDEDGAAVVPTAATWLLCDPKGNIVNNRANESISPLAASSEIVLTGEDTAITSALAGRDRLLVVRATYNSALGSGLTLRTMQRIRILETLGE